MAIGELILTGEIDVLIELEDPAAKYQERLYLKCTTWTYMLNHTIKLYDLGMIKFLADLLNFDMAFPSLATDYGKHIEIFDFSFIINNGSVERNEEKLKNIIEFTRFKAAFAAQCFMYIGENIKDDATRLLGVSGKGIECKVNKMVAHSITKKNYIAGKLSVLCVIDLLNW